MAFHEVRPEVIFTFTELLTEFIHLASKIQKSIHTCSNKMIQNYKSSRNNEYSNVILHKLNQDPSYSHNANRKYFPGN